MEVQLHAFLTPTLDGGEWSVEVVGNESGKKRTREEKGWKGIGRIGEEEEKKGQVKRGNERI
jgi:hypothetical protein